MTHPNMFLNQTEINLIKSKILINQEPWKVAYQQLNGPFVNDKSVGWAMNLPLQSVTYGGKIPPSGDRHDYFSEPPYCGWKSVDGNDPDCRDGQVNPNADRTDYISAINIGKAVRALGLAYSLTNDNNLKTQYANKAIQLINTWTVNSITKMNPKFTTFNGQSYIELSITMPGMFYGADLIYNYPGWNQSDKSNFLQWTNQLMTSAHNWGCNDPDVCCSRLTDKCQNYDNWRTAFIASAASLVDNTTELNYAFDTYRKLIKYQMDNQGKMKYEIGRTNSLSYSTYAINAMIEVAEIAKHHPELGYDLYNYKVPDGTNRGLELILDFHAPYVANPSTWPYRQITAYDGDNAVIYELAYSFKQKSGYMTAINRWGRPMYDVRNMGPVTLTHSFVQCQIPISAINIV